MQTPRIMAPERSRYFRLFIGKEEKMNENEKRSSQLRYPHDPVYNKSPALSFSTPSSPLPDLSLISIHEGFHLPQPKCQSDIRISYLYYIVGYMSYDHT